VRRVCHLVCAPPQPAVSPEAKAAAQDAKNKGNAAFSAGQFAEAATHFTAAIAADASDHIFFSNRRCAARAALAIARRAARRWRNCRAGAMPHPGMHRGNLGGGCWPSALRCAALARCG
jgi:hypothetical protein